ncbi:MAG: helix-turn-helix domain-containing protein [Oscillospiraceae bacterium]|nr:helix-turn-helix domain-containing protein [Oscillospiraceae bacterium]
MIFADKLIRLRKKSGMSQEEFAEKMNVSRQAVSKWESAQSVPDLERILKIADMFGVTTDYLLKDDIEDEEFTAVDYSEKTKKVTLEQANEYLALRKRLAPRIALGVFMCIVSVIPLLLLGGAAESGKLPISEDLAGSIGLIVILIVVAGAVGIFIHSGFQNAPYEFLDNEPFETEYGVSGMVREQQKSYRGTYMKSNVIGTCLCILSAVPLFAGIASENDFLLVILLNVLIFIVAIAVFFFVTAGVRWASMQRLLKEGDYSDEEKNRSRVNGTIAAIYWPVVVAIYLAWLFLERNPKNGDSRSWVVFPVAGVLFAAVLGIVHLIQKRKD